MVQETYLDRSSPVIQWLPRWREQLLWTQQEAGHKLQVSSRQVSCWWWFSGLVLSLKNYPGYVIGTIYSWQCIYTVWYYLQLIQCQFPWPWSLVSYSKKNVKYKAYRMSTWWPHNHLTCRYLTRALIKHCLREHLSIANVTLPVTVDDIQILCLEALLIWSSVDIGTIWS